MNVTKLVRMANQIADNFNYGATDKAVDGVEDHIRRYWTLEMKKAIVAHMDDGDTGLNAIAEDAIRKLAKNQAYAA